MDAWHLNKDMKNTAKSQSYIRLILSSGSVAAIVLAGCSDPKSQVPAGGSQVQPTPVLNESPAVQSTARQPTSSTPPTPVPVSTDEKPADPAALAKEFRSTEEPGRRGELVETLWSLDTPV